MLCYILIGWSALFALKTIILAITYTGFMFILLGGVAYTIGAVIYGIGKKKPIMHAVFHVFCIVGSILQFIAIFFYVIL
jgi:hemolysin III